MIKRVKFYISLRKSHTWEKSVKFLLCVVVLYRLSISSMSSLLFLYFSICVKLCCTDFPGVYFCCFASVFLTIYVFVLYCFCISLLVCNCFVLHQLFLRQPKSAAMRLPPQQWSLQQIQIQLQIQIQIHKIIQTRDHFSFLDSLSLHTNSAFTANLRIRQSQCVECYR